MKTRSFVLMYLFSPLAIALFVGVVFLFRYFVGPLPDWKSVQIIFFVLYWGLVTTFFTGMIGAIVKSNEKGRAAGAVFGLLIGIGLLVASFFIIREQILEGPTDFGHMMVFGALPIPLVIFVLALPFLGVMAFFKSIKILLDLSR